MTYARTTKVTTDATRSAIERELHKHGVERCAFATQPGKGLVHFDIGKLSVRVTVSLPERSAFELDSRERRRPEGVA